MTLMTTFTLKLCLFLNKVYSTFVLNLTFGFCLTFSTCFVYFCSCLVCLLFLRRLSLRLKKLFLHGFGWFCTLG